MKVLVTEPLAEEGVARLRAEQDIEVDVRLDLSPDDLAGCIGDYAGLIVRSKTRVTRALLEAAPALRIVGRAGTGVDNIDLEAATDRGVVVVNTPGGNSVSVAELTIGLVIACARHIPRADHTMKQGQWAKKELRGRELNGKTIGIVGMGRIGREVALRARPFGLKVLGYDPFVAADDLEEQGIRMVEIDELLEKSHIVTLHVPVNDKTRNLIDADALARMQDGVILVNAARGGVIDEQALIEAIEGGKVGAAALDAFMGEPAPRRDLVGHERVVASPHIGASTVEAQEQVGYYVAGFVADYLARGVLQSAVNYPAVTADEMHRLRAYLVLASRLGAFVSQIASGRMQELQITYCGDLAGARYEVLTDRALSAALRPFLDELDVNPINARSLARNRGLRVTEAISRADCGFAGLIRAVLSTSDGMVAADGTAVGADRPPRLVAVDGLSIDAPLEGPTLFFRNDDVPGVIGRVGNFAGERGINIANFALRSDGEGGAVGLVQVGRRVTREERDQLRQVPEIRFVRAVDLP